MPTRRPPSPAVLPALHPTVPRCHGGISSLLRTGLQSSPQRLAPVARVVNERPFFLQQRAPSTQLNLFGPATPR